MQDFDAAHAFAVQAALAAIGDLDAGRDEKILTHAACRLGGAVIARSAATWRSRSRQAP